MANKYARGSEWRRWDLHIHTPESCLRHNLPSWNDYLETLESAPKEICAIGATDYMSIKGYEKLKAEKENGRLKNIDLIIPNIEFRIFPHTKPGKGINFHLLFDVSDPNHVDEIKCCLTNLKYEFQERQYGCSETELKKLGQAFKPDVASDKETLREGMKQFRPSFDLFRKWYKEDAWLRQNSLVVVDNSTRDGASTLQNDSGYNALRNEIYRFSDAIFSSKLNDVNYFLGRSSDGVEEILRRYGGPLPCIWGSDSVALDKLFKPDLSRYCWIKADPTFEGLKQILYEPATRIHIGKTYPDERDRNRIIKSITLGKEARPDWLDLETLDLNSGLVAIIGNKGTGKTALVDFIAYATGAWDPNSPNSFIRKSQIEDIEVSIKWEGGDSLSHKITKKYEPDDQRTKYLSQQFVEDLCANNIVGEKLRDEIESVIFQHLEPEQKLSASGFEALRSKRMKGINDKRQTTWKFLQDNMVAFLSLEDEISTLNDKKDRLKQLSVEETGLIKQIPKIDSKEQEYLAKKLSETRDDLSKIEARIAELRANENDIEILKSRVGHFQSVMDQFHTDIVPELRRVGISEKELDNFKPQFKGDATQLFESRLENVKTEISRIKNKNEERPTGRSLDELEATIKTLEEQSSLDEQTRKRIEALQLRIREIASKKANLLREIDEIENTKITLRDQRWFAVQEKYFNIFQTFEEEQKILDELYLPLSKRLSTSGAQEKHLEFVLEKDIDVSAWAERGEQLVDHGKKGSFRQYGLIEERAKKLLLHAWKSGKQNKLKDAIEGFVGTFKENNYKIEQQLKSSASLEDFYQWIFSTDHIRLTYNITFNGIGLAQLSPGTKGLVLLMLYLEIDDNDRRPLLVDQPEENLDNESIYETLREYFRKARTRRQIILVTHNPNLVVNTDADQVIIASAHESETEKYPKLSYLSGSLENNAFPSRGDSIRDKICRILEGGFDAFRKRERRYSTRHS